MSCPSLPPSVYLLSFSLSLSLSLYSLSVPLSLPLHLSLFYVSLICLFPSVFFPSVSFPLSLSLYLSLHVSPISFTNSPMPLPLSFLSLTLFFYLTPCLFPSVPFPSSLLLYLFPLSLICLSPSMCPLYFSFVSPPDSSHLSLSFYLLSFLTPLCLSLCPSSYVCIPGSSQLLIFCI